MGLGKGHRPVKLFVGMFAGQEELFDTARSELGRAYGAVDHISPVWPFDFTTYYAEEFGEPAQAVPQFLGVDRCRQVARGEALYE